MSAVLLLGLVVVYVIGVATFAALLLILWAEANEKIRLHRSLRHTAIRLAEQHHPATVTELYPKSNVVPLVVDGGDGAA